MENKLAIVSGYAIVQRSIDGRFLIVERQLCGRKAFDLPGGTRKTGEKMVQTITRVMAEDLAMHFEPHHFIGWNYHIFDDTDGERVCNVRVTFSGIVNDLNVFCSDTLSTTNITARWMNLSELKADGVQLHATDALHRLREYSEGGRQSLDMCGEIRE